jgi:hypothetical protein
MREKVTYMLGRELSTDVTILSMTIEDSKERLLVVACKMSLAVVRVLVGLLPSYSVSA